MEDVVINILTNADGTYKTFKQLCKTTEDLKDDLSTLDKNSKEYVKTLNDLGKVQTKINDINRTASTVTMTAMQVTTEALSGLSAGLGAAGTAMSLFGIESEGLNEVLGKVQTGLQLTQQLSTLSNSVKMAETLFKKFNLTLLANPLLLVTGLIAALITAFGKWDDVIDIIKETIQSFWEDIKGIGEVIGDLVKDFIEAIPFFNDTDDAFKKNRRNHLRGNKCRHKIGYRAFENYRQINKRRFQRSIRGCQRQL